MTKPARHVKETQYQGEKKIQMKQAESTILEALDIALRSESIRPKIDAIVARVEQKLRERPDDALAWEPIPLELYVSALPTGIRSSWVFILCANTNTGAERHPNSHQRMMSYRGTGDFQTRKGGKWRSNLLASDQTKPVAERWISIPPYVWHRGIVSSENWVVVSFHTAAENELIEERPVSATDDTVRQSKYTGEG
jgi:hypothetical protein